MQNERNQISCLKQSGKISKFCLQQSQVLRASAAHLYRNCPCVPPGGGLQRQYPYIGYTMQLDTGKIS